ncbi:MAG: threonine ammonia-lyase [Pseudomonadales bacterium]
MGDVDQGLIGVVMNRTDVVSARERLRSSVHATPVLRSEYLDRRLKLSLHFKAEHLQHTGSFKFRGAMNAVNLLKTSGFEGTICTHSSGNHGAALARAGRLAGYAVTVVMPMGANRLKAQSVVDEGGEIIWCAASNAARLEAVEALQRASNAHLVPPFDDDRIIAGQGTAALELLEVCADLDVLLVPVGGGGLLAGSLLAAEGVSVYGVEPALADDTARSVESGIRCGIDQSMTICDGLRASVGMRPFEMIHRDVAGILTVTEEAVTRATAQLWRDLKSWVEPSAATVLAAVNTYRDKFEGQKVGAILSGGNVDFSALQKAPYQRWLSDELSSRA